MRAPLSWLREFAPVEGDAADLAAALSGLGLVVEGIERVGEGLAEIIVGRVLATRRHPGADRVQLVDVDDGGAGSRQVVCGAFNFGAGDLVALAPIGARLPGGLEIARRKVRGEWSEGMLCSAAELALADDAAGIMVLANDGGAAPGAALTEVLGITADVVFDIDVTPNRPDALSIVGIARDLAARLGVPFAVPEPSPPSITDDARSRSAPEVDGYLRVESPDLCPLFISTVLAGAVVGPSPAWLGRRLVLAGMRPINNIVDVSNYVMLERGQPNHPYDLDRLAGAGLLVRRARDGEEVITLDGVHRSVGRDDCLICDAEGVPVGIGGIMGGASSEISDSTTRVLLETAWFTPTAIARTAKRLGLRTEASVRFERGVDPEGVAGSAARFVELAGQVAGATPASGAATRRGEVPVGSRVIVRTDRVNGVLGTSLASEEVRSLLEPIGFSCLAVPGNDGGGEGSFTVTVPGWRPDCEREIDVIEEVARHHGYAAIQRTLPVVSQVGRLSGYQVDRRQARQILVGCGLAEAWATSFCSVDDLVRCGLEPRAVEIENPLVAEESVLRPSLLPGLLKALVTNASHRHADVELFEIGHVFIPPPADRLPAEGASPVLSGGYEPERLAVLLGGADATAAVRVWHALAGGLRLAEISIQAAVGPGLHPGRCAAVAAGGHQLGFVGELDPEVVAAHGLGERVGWLEVDLGAMLTGPRLASSYRPVSRFPSADVDLAFEVAEEVSASCVEATLRESVGELLESLVLFDVFRGVQLGPGRRSLAWRLRLSALDRTLTDEEIVAVRRRAISKVESSHSAKLRGE